MKTHLAILTAALIFSGEFAFAQQQQYDSLGSPTPAPHQNASPTAPQPNVPISKPDINKNTSGVNGEKSFTTGSGTVSGNAAGATTGVDAPNNNGGATPNGMIDD
jgi:hypothetical protein